MDDELFAELLESVRQGGAILRGQSQASRTFVVEGSMTTNITNITIHNVQMAGGILRVELSDGRSITIPLAWYPRLFHGTPQERNNWRLIGRGVGIHWPDLDEDLSVEGIILGRPSNESQNSLQRWLESRQKD